VGSARLYLAVAAKQFQRRLAYRTSNLAGIFTNTVFGFLRTAVFVALFAAQPIVAGYDLEQMVTYSWMIQSTMNVVQLWGWYDVEETIRSGDVVSDLSKPFSYLGYWLSQDFGRAAYYVIYRGVPLYLVGHLAAGMRLPESPLTWLLFALSLAMGVVVAFAWRFMLNLTAFWTTDARGINVMGMAIATFVGGFVFPLPFFPEPYRSIALALPFAGTTQTPIDVYLERLPPDQLIAALGLQALWCVVMLVLSQLLVTAATRRVVIQGG
jgi:ABC-2 type transport system permease protein